MRTGPWPSPRCSSTCTRTSPGKIEPYKVEYWALVELMGHQRILGLVRQSELGGGHQRILGLVRQSELGGGLLEVLALDEQGHFAFSRILSPQAIYAINPMAQEVAQALAREGVNQGANPILGLPMSKLREKLRKEILDEIEWQETNQAEEQGDDLL
jgi:hypothetical protein